MSDIHGPQDKSGTWDLVGTPDNDSLYGGKGSNHYDGGAGEDTVVYGGNSFQYEVKFDADSRSYKIGSDTLKNVEYIQFADVRMKVEDATHIERPQYHFDNDTQQMEINDIDVGHTLQGGDGNDTFTGNGGDDTLYGGKGEDTAVFRGNRADYDVRYDYNSNHYVVTDRHAGRDGSDKLAGIEQLKFADTTISLHGIYNWGGSPDDATIAKLDGVIEAPPPPPMPDYSEWVGHGDLAVRDNIALITIDSISMDNLFVVGMTATTASAAFVSIEAAAEPVALAGVPATFSFAGTGGFTLDAP